MPASKWRYTRLQCGNMLQQATMRENAAQSLSRDTSSHSMSVDVTRPQTHPMTRSTWDKRWTGVSRWTKLWPGAVMLGSESASSFTHASLRSWWGGMMTADSSLSSVPVATTCAGQHPSLNRVLWLGALRVHNLGYAAYASGTYAELNEWR